MGGRYRRGLVAAATGALLVGTLAGFSAIPRGAGTPADVDEDVHVDPVNHFEARIPPGWHPMPASLVEEFDRNADVLLDSDKPFRFVAGYTTAPGGELTVPYVLFQVTDAPMNQFTEEELVAQFDARTLNKELVTTYDFLAELDFSIEPTWDPVRKRVLMSIDVEQPGVGSVRGFAAGEIAGHGVMQVNCYVDPADVEAALPACEQWMDGLRIEEGYEWRPGGGVPFDVADAGSRAMVGALAGGVLGAGAVLLALRRRFAG